MSKDHSNSKKLDTLVEDIYETLSCLCEQKDLDISDEAIEDFGERMKDVLRHWSTPYKEAKGLRMSNIGRPMRQLWYDVKEDLPVFNRSHPQVFIKFLYGHMLEEVVLLLVKLAGHEVTGEQKEVEVDGIVGHMDCVIDGEVVDIKTTSGFAFKKFKEGTLPQDDPFGYMSQLAGYEEAEGTNNGGFLALNKESGELSLFRPGDLEKPNVKSRIKHIKEHLETDTPPDRCYVPIAEGVKGNLKLAVGCVYCAHKNKCWSDANNGQGLRVFKYSNGLKYFTRVVAEPKVEEVSLRSV
tara:strand:- start:627 stop:1514 length:888 start_codon:yes stop_codon:yes gene_type:complete